MSSIEVPVDSIPKKRVGRPPLDIPKKGRYKNVLLKADLKRRLDQKKEVSGLKNLSEVINDYLTKDGF